MKLHSAFVDEIINNSPEQRNLLVVARVPCACHCRINLKSKSSRPKKKNHVLITFKCTMEGCKRDLNASACLDKEEVDTIISEGDPLWAGAHISGNLEHDTRTMLQKRQKLIFIINERLPGQ